MNGNKINFDDKKIIKTEFYKNKKVFQIDDIEKNNMAKKTTWQK